jgi:integrase
MELALETTSRRADVTRIGPQHERGGKLDLRHTKNNSEAFIPITPELRAAIDACPTRHLTFLHTKGGAPRSAKALGGDFRKWCDDAGLPKRCTIHGLRKGGARRLAEAGATAREIMAVTAHKTLSEVERYTKAADRKHLAESAMQKLVKSRS